jgi:hypothetical protein
LKRGRTTSLAVSFALALSRFSQGVGLKVEEEEETASPSRL